MKRWIVRWLRQYAMRTGKLRGLYMRPLAHLRSRGSRSGYRFLIFHLRFRACRCLGRFVGLAFARLFRAFG